MGQLGTSQNLLNHESLSNQLLTRIILPSAATLSLNVKIKAYNQASVQDRPPADTRPHMPSWKSRMMLTNYYAHSSFS